VNAAHEAAGTRDGARRRSSEGQRAGVRSSPDEQLQSRYAQLWSDIRQSHGPHTANGGRGIARPLTFAALFDRVGLLGQCLHAARANWRLARGDKSDDDAP
jgi:hypothetical protein